MDFTTIEQCAPTVAPTTMQRIIRVESAGKPHAIGYHITKDGKTYRLTLQPKDKADRQRLSIRCRRCTDQLEQLQTSRIECSKYL
jgi:hypothetical protein